MFVSDRNILIDKDNKILLRRMEEISLTPQTDCHLHRRAAQTNYGHRVLYVNQLNEDNLVKEAPQHTAHTPCVTTKQTHTSLTSMPHLLIPANVQAHSAHTPCVLSQAVGGGAQGNAAPHLLHERVYIRRAAQEFHVWHLQPSLSQVLATHTCTECLSQCTPINSAPSLHRSHSKSGKSHTNSSSSSAAASGLSKRPSTVAAGGSRRRRRGANESSSSKASTSSGSGMRRVASSGARLSSTRRRRGGKKRGARKQPAGGRSMHEGDSDVLQPLAAVGSGGGGGSGSRVSAAGSAATAASSTNDGVLHAAAPSQLDTDDHDNTPVAGSAQPDSLPPLTAGGGAGGGAGAGASRKDVPPVDLGSLSKEEQQRLGDLKHAELSPVRIV